MTFRESRIYKLARREVVRMLQRPLYLLCMVGAPLLCFAFFPTLMGEGLPESLPAGVVDEDNTSLSRQILRNLDSFQQTEIIHQYSNFNEAREAMQQGEIYAFYYIPKGTSHKAQRSEQPLVSFYTNSSYLVAGSLLYKDMTMMSEYAAAGVGREVLLAKGATMDQAMTFLQPIRVDVHAVHNPWLNYSIYLNSILLPAILSLLVLLVTTFSIHTELKDATSKEWLEMAGGNIYIAVTGKLLPLTIIFSIMGCMSMVWLYGFLDFPLNSGIFPMLLAIILLILGSQGFSIFLCSMMPSLRWSLSLCTLWGVFSIPIAGFSFPVMAMPPALQSLSNLFPLRYYYLICVDQALNGLDFHYSAHFYLALCVFVLLPFIDIKLLRHTALNYVYMK